MAYARSCRIVLKPVLSCNRSWTTCAISIPAVSAAIPPWSISCASNCSAGWMAWNCNCANSSRALVAAPSAIRIPAASHRATRTRSPNTIANYPPPGSRSRGSDRSHKRRRSEPRPSGSGWGSDPNQGRPERKRPNPFSQRLPRRLSTRRRPSTSAAALSPAGCGIIAGKRRMEFVDQLKSAVDIVSVVGEYVRLRKSSAYRYVGLCPFHSEKTPSFSVHASRQFYHCFGCHAHADVLKFVMEIEGVGFYDALKNLAERYGIPMPKRSQYSDEDSRRRAALLEMHELAQDNFRENLNGPAGQDARAYLARRGVRPETIAEFALGYSDRSGRALLRLFEQRGFPADLIEASGLAGRRQDGSFYDRFRNRLMFPIRNESGKIIAYGGRALAADDEPKYMNSPETPIYKKSFTLYNLHRAKDAIS